MLWYKYMSCTLTGALRIKFWIKLFKNGQSMTMKHSNGIFFNEISEHLGVQISSYFKPLILLLFTADKCKKS